MRCCKEWALYGCVVGPKPGCGGGMRLRESEGDVNCGAFVVPAISQAPFTTQHGRVLQKQHTVNKKETFTVTVVPQGDRCPLVVSQRRKWWQTHPQQGLQSWPLLDESRGLRELEQGTLDSFPCWCSQFKSSVC